jgi:hypothetical protein
MEKNCIVKNFIISFPVEHFPFYVCVCVFDTHATSEIDLPPVFTLTDLLTFYLLAMVGIEPGTF